MVNVEREVDFVNELISISDETLQDQDGHLPVSEISVVLNALEFIAI